MLPTWMIEEIEKRRREREVEERPALHVELPISRDWQDRRPAEDAPERGGTVIVIEY
jgi:hypothetical protein